MLSHGLPPHRLWKGLVYTINERNLLEKLDIFGFKKNGLQILYRHRHIMNPGKPKNSSAHIATTVVDEMLWRD
jgi:hypothetical protein